MDPTQWNVPFVVIVAALFVIVMSRANGTYWLGRLSAEGARRTRFEKLMAAAAYQRAVDRVNQYGAPIVALSFLTIGFQTLANLAAGATRMPMRSYLPAVILGGAAWAVIYATIGSVGVDLVVWLWGRSPWLAGGVAVGLVGIAGYFVWRRHQAIKV